MAASDGGAAQSTPRRRGKTAKGRPWPRDRCVSPGYDAAMPTELDAIDRKILALVQEDASRPADAIGGMVGLSASAVQRRLARLRETGVIEGEIAVVDPKALGRPLTMIVDVELERERPELLASFKRWIAAEPAVQQAWYVTGDGDYVLVVTACDVEEYDALMQRLVADNANVRSFRTRVSLATLKRGLAVPTD
jgi:DNA-binding Lrp family transcriptional regulator